MYNTPDSNLLFINYRQTERQRETDRQGTESTTVRQTDGLIARQRDRLKDE